MCSTTTRRTAAYQQGRLAGARGYTFESNPYPMGDHSRYGDWDRGLRDYYDDKRRGDIDNEYAGAD